MVAPPWTVCGRGHVRRYHAICGMCRVPRARCFVQRLAMDSRMIGVEVHVPQLRLVGYAHVCSLREICLRLSGHVAFALQHWRNAAGHNNGIPSCHQYGASRVASGGNGLCMMAVFTASRHFMAVQSACSSPSPLSEVGTAVPPFIFHSLLPSCYGCVDHFAARGSRTSPAHDARLRAHQDVRNRSFLRCARDQRVQEKQNKSVVTLQPGHNRH